MVQDKHHHSCICVRCEYERKKQVSEYNWRDHWEEKTPGGYTVIHVDLVRSGWEKGPRHFIVYILGRTPFFAKHDGKPCDNENRGGNCDDLVPKRKLRPWTAKEWGARIGDEFIYGAGNKVTLSIVKIAAIYPRYNIDGNLFEVLLEDTTQLKQLDGSPCGEYE